MAHLLISDWVSLYAAFLSTVLALAALAKWLLAGPRLSVTVFNPHETDSGAQAFLSIVSNSGQVATVVQRLEVSFRTSRWPWGKEIGKAVFDEKSRWKPSTRLVRAEGKQNTFQEEPNVLQPNAEIRAPALPISAYRADLHWIRVIAMPRSSRRRFAGWAGPLPNALKTEAASGGGVA